MIDPLYSLDLTDLNQVNPNNLGDVHFALESGQIVYLPTYAFKLLPEERPLLSESVLHPKQKNISYDYRRQHLAGLINSDPHTSINVSMSSLMQRYANYAKQLIDALFPIYTDELIWGRTSYRPAEIKGRATSARKDDTRVHVDAFPSTPVNGQRILRVFCNINPNDQVRLWEVGESFPEVLHTFHPTMPPYRALHAKILKWIKATKTLRSPYDHYMLHLHDQMKLSNHYQNTVHKHQIPFPSNSTWIVFTDQVSHAALSGQYLLEQTFYLPISAMQFPALSPLKQLENVFAM
jgi:hypothetical protein